MWWLSAFLYISASRLVCCQVITQGIGRHLTGDYFGVAGRNVTFDYVVVGGGNAGLAIAARLAEDPNITVAVVEAGNYYELANGNISQVPHYDVFLDGQTEDTQWATPSTDWGFLTTPQTATDNKVLHYTRGKTLGGSSALNSQIYNRGSKDTYNGWANLTGDDIWTWDNLLPYFTRGIEYTGDDRYRAANASTPEPEPDAVDPQGGPLHLSLPNFGLPSSSWIAEAMQSAGINETRSLIGGNLIGRQYNPFTHNPERATRDSSESSYLASSQRAGRTNLVTYVNTLAKKIRFDNSSTPVATGVEVSWNPRAPNSLLTARKEVVVSAGAIQSPQLLMVSGIGPAAHLATHNIPLVVDSPGVGQNLWEHFLVILSRPTIFTGGFNQFQNDPEFAARAMEQYTTNQTSILTNGNTDYLGWEKLPAKYRAALGANITARLDASFPADWPELEIEAGDGSLTTAQSAMNNSQVSLIGGLVAPFSRGSISLASNNTYDPPVIDIGLLNDPDDQKIAVQVFHRLREIMAQPIMESVLMGEEALPGPQVQTDEEILAYITSSPGFNWHAACTCKMGVESDTMAVLDGRARVRGVRNLRVVDASSFPTLPPGHPMASVYALAEAIAADIKGTT